MGFERIIEGGGIVISITGLLVVFAGLLLISLYIAAIPRLLGGLEQRKAQRAERRRRAVAAPLPTDDPALLAHFAVGELFSRQEWEYFKSRYRPFRLTHSGRTLAFAGVGADSVPGAWQLAISRAARSDIELALLCAVLGFAVDSLWVLRISATIRRPCRGVPTTAGAVRP